MAATEQQQAQRFAVGDKPTAGSVLPEFPKFSVELPDWAREKYSWLAEASTRYDAKMKKWRDDTNVVLRNL